jgi:hypothetical protein
MDDELSWTRGSENAMLIRWEIRANERGPTVFYIEANPYKCFSQANKVEGLIHGDSRVALLLVEYRIFNTVHPSFLVVRLWIRSRLPRK